MERMKELEAHCTIVRGAQSESENAYELTFTFGLNRTTIRIVFDDMSGADMAITNMTTLPETGKGCGSAALNVLLAWAQAHGLRDIRAIQVQRPSESFWIKNGFAPTRNRTNDFRHQGN